MYHKEIRIPHSKIGDSKTITKATTKAMEDAGCDIHTHEVGQMDDNFKTGERILKVERHGTMFMFKDVSQERWDNIFNKRKVN